MSRLLTLLIAMGCAGGLGLMGYFQHWRSAPLNLESDGLVFVVEEGDSLHRVSRRLSKLGVLTHRRAFNLLGRMTGADQRIAQGEYRIPAGSTPDMLLGQLQAGDTIRYLVTLPEGLRLREVLELLSRTDGVAPVLEGPSDPRLLALVAPVATAEGFFLPETYQYQRGDTDLSILREAHRLMRTALDDAWRQRHADVPLESSYEALVLASIIEKETGLAAERPQIGGVFARRLQAGMRLQTDPTVIYGLGDTFNGNLTRAHLRDETNPYNSYRHHGLPPGPIALPGREALMAAVTPAAGNSLYFVARGDGSHEFSATLEQHEAAVARYQLQRRRDYRSSPQESRP